MDRYYRTHVTVPAHTLAAAPQLTPWQLEAVTLVEVTIDTPPGHLYLTGLALQWHQANLIPFGGDAFLTGNAENRTYQLHQDLDYAPLIIACYNTDRIPHTFYLTGHLRDLPPPAPGLSIDTATGGDGGQLIVPPLDLGGQQGGAPGPGSGTGGTPPPSTIRQLLQDAASLLDGAAASITTVLGQLPSRTATTPRRRK